MVKYSVYNPYTGENILFENKDQALQEFWKIVVAFAKSHMHNTAYSVIEQNSDGSEKWYNDNNQEIDRPKTANEIMQLIENARLTQ